MQVNDNGVWKPATPHVNDNGTWKPVQEGWVNANGVWSQYYSAGPPGPTMLTFYPSYYSTTGSWSNTVAIKQEDGTYASAYVSSSSEATIYAREFGIAAAVPSTAQLVGLKVMIKVYKGDSRTVELHQRLCLNQVDKTWEWAVHPPQTPTVYTYGSETDNWQTGHYISVPDTLALIRDPNFRVRLTSYCSSGSVFVYFDYIKLVVYFNSP